VSLTELSDVEVLNWVEVEGAGLGLAAAAGRFTGFSAKEQGRRHILK
jgi:hypothetical protein